MKKRISWVVIMCFASGCAAVASLDRPLMSTFELLPSESGDNKFYYVAETASVAYPDNDKGESIRMGWLQYYLDLNEICQDGYEITSRQATNINKSINEPQKRIVYYGKCPKT